MRRFRLVGALLCGALLAPPPAQAHGIHASYATITVSPARVELAVTLHLADLLAHVPLDPNGDQRLSPDELRAVTPAIFAFVERNTALAVDGAPAALTRDAVTLQTDAAHQEFLHVAFHAPIRVPPSRVSLGLEAGLFEALGQRYNNFVKVVSGEQTQQAVLSLQDPSREFFLAQPPRLASQLQQFLVLGVRHIFLGYDHLMFLLALILVGGRLRTLVKIVTAFTIAHSATLILAALRLVALPPRLIESGIALSILYVGVENFFITRADHRWRLTFAFGLVHGFGFASVLRELGLPTQGLVASLLAFNVGVELGQLSVVAVLFPLTLRLARQPWRRGAITAVSSIVAVCGLGWFVERAFRLSFMPF